MHDPRLAWLSHTSRELIWSAARTCSTGPSPAPDDARLLARPNAVVAAFWLAWPLTTAAGPCSGSAGSACTTNQRDRPPERTSTGAPPTGAGTPATTTGAPPTGAGTPATTAAAPPAVPIVAVSFAATTGSATRAARA